MLLVPSKRSFTSNHSLLRSTRSGPPPFMPKIAPYAFFKWTVGRGSVVWKIWPTVLLHTLFASVIVYIYCLTVRIVQIPNVMLTAMVHGHTKPAPDGRLNSPVSTPSVPPSTATASASIATTSSSGVSTSTTRIPSNPPLPPRTPPNALPLREPRVSRLNPPAPSPGIEPRPGAVHGAQPSEPRHNPLCRVTANVAAWVRGFWNRAKEDHRTHHGTDRTSRMRTWSGPIHPVGVAQLEFEIGENLPEGGGSALPLGMGYDDNDLDLDMFCHDIIRKDIRCLKKAPCVDAWFPPRPIITDSTATGGKAKTNDAVGSPDASTLAGGLHAYGANLYRASLASLSDSASVITEEEGEGMEDDPDTETELEHEARTRRAEEVVRVGELVDTR
ncbi:hypothetical protein MSAN_01215900 [Mycena sanguinolenta]|uniref:Uncharacterized protein n=1 Tax=Mycena sanguinolenta TaxID=230812 RepID=A0A8H6YGX6_9AGAR|nr:hypothetical protein MSAN_01215900 [Mycena sanguinolenta]